MEELEKLEVIRVNLLIMRTFWDAYFGHNVSKDDKETDFFVFLGMGKTKTSNVINGTDDTLKEGVRENVENKASMSGDVLKGLKLLKVGGRLEKEFKKYGKDMTEKKGWKVYLKDKTEDFQNHIQNVLRNELRRQITKGVVDDDLRSLLYYMKDVKGIIYSIKDDIQSVSVSKLMSCTDRELEEYKTVLEEEYRLVEAIRTLRASKKTKIETQQVSE